MNWVFRLLRPRKQTTILNSNQCISKDQNRNCQNGQASNGFENQRIRIQTLAEEEEAKEETKEEAKEEAEAVKEKEPEAVKEQEGADVMDRQQGSFVVEAMNSGFILRVPEINYIIIFKIYYIFIYVHSNY